MNFSLMLLTQSFTPIRLITSLIIDALIPPTGVLFIVNKIKISRHKIINFYKLLIWKFLPC